ncbi:MAG TPA: helix-turn-helix domain-containing protein [Ktedonobacterales bacterium]|nr:helix-turn-helix domain-containing protein [Ktedonobacterales bacterium]HEU5378830.1 helix-turn-helix domain-containing protein [Ktedonobacteraceae bacterium]
MPKRLKLTEHLSLAELEQRYRHAKDPVERSQWQILWLLARGAPSEQVAQATGYSLNWIRRIAQRYNTTGAAGVLDQRHHNSGAAPLLSAAQQEELRTVLQAALASEDMWTGPQVAAWIVTKVGHPVHPQRGWEWLRRLGFDPKTARFHQPRTHSDP